MESRLEGFTGAHKLLEMYVDGVGGQVQSRGCFLMERDIPM